VHALDTTCKQPMHIDTTVIPLAEGKVMINPDFVRREDLPACFDDWEIREAPRPVPNPTAAPTPSSQWLSINVLVLDGTRVIVEEAQTPLIEMLSGWGFEPIPCRFAHYALFGGGFHCATLDVRRRPRGAP
jgi:glycine amidinotransferase